MTKKVYLVEAEDYHQKHIFSTKEKCFECMSKLYDREIILGRRKMVFEIYNTTDWEECKRKLFHDNDLDDMRWEEFILE